MSLPAFSILQVFGKSAFSLKSNFKGLILSSFLTAASNSPYLELSGFHFQGILTDKKTKNEVWSKREPAAVFRYISVCQVSHTPITAHAGVSQVQEHRLQHVWEIQKIDMKLSGALNRMLRLMPTKTGSKQRKIKKGSVTHHVCPAQVTFRCRTQMVPAWHPRHCWRSACRLARGRDRSRTQVLAKESSLRQGSSFVKSKTLSLHRVSSTFPPPIPKEPHAGTWRLGPGEKAAECSVGNSRRWDLIDLRASAGRESAGSNHQLHFEGI